MIAFRLRIALALGVAAAVAGCGESETDPSGPADPAAMALCDGFEGAATDLTASPDAPGAAGAVLEPGRLYRIALPDGSESRATFRSTVEHADYAIGVAPAGVLVGLEGGLPGARRSGVCPDAVAGEHRVHLHETGDYTLTFAAEGERTVTVFVALEGSGHGMHGADGDHDHGDHDHGDHDHGDHDHGDHDHGDHDHGDHDHGDRDGGRAADGGV